MNSSRLPTWFIGACGVLVCTTVDDFCSSISLGWANVRYSYIFADLLSWSTSLGLSFISSHLMRHLGTKLLLGKRRATGNLHHSSEVPQTWYRASASMKECTWINRNTEQHDLFKKLPQRAKSAQQKSNKSKKKQKPFVLQYSWQLCPTSYFHIKLGTCGSLPRFYNVKRLQEQSSPIQRDVLPDWSSPTYDQDSKRDRPTEPKPTRLSLNSLTRGSPESTHQPLPPTAVAGESYTFSFSWAGGTLISAILICLRTNPTVEYWP